MSTPVKALLLLNGALFAINGLLLLFGLGGFAAAVGLGAATFCLGALALQAYQGRQ